MASKDKPSEKKSTRRDYAASQSVADSEPLSSYAKGRTEERLVSRFSSDSSLMLQPAYVPLASKPKITSPAVFSIYMTSGKGGARIQNQLLKFYPGPKRESGSNISEDTPPRQANFRAGENVSRDSYAKEPSEENASRKSYTDSQQVAHTSILQASVDQDSRKNADSMLLTERMSEVDISSSNSQRTSKSERRVGLSKRRYLTGKALPGLPSPYPTVHESLESGFPPFNESSARSSTSLPLFGSKKVDIPRAKSMLTRTSLRSPSSASSSQSQKISINELLGTFSKKHISGDPRETHSHIIQYMQSDFNLRLPSDVALWDPSPGLQGSPKKIARGVEPGDVGYFSKSGGFISLFNIFQSAEKNYHELRLEPPKNFEPFVGYNIEKGLRHIFIPVSKKCTGGDITATSSQYAEQNESFSFEMKHTCTTASVLVLPKGAALRALKIEIIKAKSEYFAVQIPFWYEFARVQQKLTNGQLALVEGVYMAELWGILCYRSGSGDKIKPPGITATFQPVSGTDNQYQWVAPYASGLHTHMGPSAKELQLADVSGTKQCVGIQPVALWERGKEYSLFSSDTVKSIKDTIFK